MGGNGVDIAAVYLLPREDAETVIRHDAKFAAIDRRFDTMDRKFEALERKVDASGHRSPVCGRP